MKEKPEYFGVKLSRAEKYLFEAEAHAEGMKPADLFRTLIRDHAVKLNIPYPHHIANLEKEGNR